jgi:hypothetical protein
MIYFVAVFFACSFAILIIHLVFFILLFLIDECESLTPQKHFKPLYTFHHSSLLFFDFSKTATSGRIFQVFVSFCFYASLVGQKKQQGMLCPF